MSAVINGRFLCAAQTGVQRVAANLTLALDELIAETRQSRGGDWLVRAPRGAAARIPLRAMRFAGDSLLTGQAWEQLELPLAAGGAKLVNLCNAGPLNAPSALTLIHDAQVYLAPQSYSPAFRRWYRFALPRLAARSRRVATVSEFSRNMLARFGVAPLERIEVIPNGVDHILQAPADRGVLVRLDLGGKPYVAAFGSLQPHKNLAHLLRVFADPALAGVELVVCGGLTAAQAAAALGIAPGRNVQFAGRLSDGEIRALLEGALCLACPSTTEGFGLPPLEAMRLGCPAVVSPAGALPEVCGAAAVYAPLDGTEPWVRAIVGLAADAAGREARRHEGRSHAARYTWRRSAERLLELLTSEA